MDLLNEMIITLALFKIIKSPSNIFILPQNFVIYIELANTFDNALHTKLLYSQYIKRTLNIGSFDLTKLQFDHENPLEDPIPYVCANLQMYTDSSIKNDVITPQLT